MKDNVIAKDKWEFNEEVAKCFSDMIARSIPDFWSMRELIKSLSLLHLENLNTTRKTVLDLGCSNGESISQYVNLTDVSVTAVDNSLEMIEECKLKYSYVNPYNLQLFHKNIEELYIPTQHYDIIQSILTIQFIPMNYRQEVINNIYNGLHKGGCFIFVEKCLPVNTELKNRYRKLYHKIKSDNGYTEEQIYNKEKALENVLIPLTYDWNVDMLKNAGFKTIDCFWKYLNFCGFIAIKD